MLETDLVGAFEETHTDSMNHSLGFWGWLLLCGSALGALGCSTGSSAENSENGPPSGDGDGDKPALGDGDGDGDTIGEGNGQTGGIGAAECFEDTDCEDVLDLWLSEFASPGGYVPEFTSAACEQVGVIGAESAEGGACACFESGDNGSRDVGPVGLSCFAYDRAGNCIFSGDEFSGCEVGTSEGDAMCADECQKLQERMAEAAERTYETEARYAKCEDYNCTTVSRVGELCHVNHNTSYEYSRDCSQTDEELIEEFIEARDGAQDGASSGFLGGGMGGAEAGR